MSAIVADRLEVLQRLVGLLQPERSIGRQSSCPAARSGRRDLELATSSMPMMVLPPPRFSTITCWPSSAAHLLGDQAACRSVVALGQRPASTWTMKSPTRRLNWSGSSMLMVWPQFGVTASAGRGISRFIGTEGGSARPVLVAGQDQGRMVIASI